MVRCVLVVTCGSTSNQSSIAITLASAGLINYFVWWILSLIFLRFEGLTSHRSWGRGVFSLKTSVTTLCSQQSGALATPECLCMVSDLISQPRVIFGRIVGSALIRSRVCIMASTLWIPYCSRTAPHFRSWTWTKRYTTEIPNINTGWRKSEHMHRNAHGARTLSAGGWWWTENRAPMMMSPGMWVKTLLSVV